MTTIERNPASAESDHYDIIVVGGGIYGAMLLLEAARRGQRALLLEKQDFGSGTSYNSLRIIHGGLRYLQSLDLARFFESVAERRWFLQTFPDLVKPLPCLMPLYKRGLKRPAVLRTALLVNDLLSSHRNTGVRIAQTIPTGRILDAGETRQLFAGVDPDELSGAALWYDAHIPDSQRVIMETLRWACHLGAQALNYIEAHDLLTTGTSVAGVRACDRETGDSFEFRAETVINATGPGSRALSACWDRDIPALCRPSLAWNVLFDCPAPSTHALALTPKRSSGQTYFLHPWKGRLLAGTGHAPWTGSPGIPAPGKELLGQFVGDMNMVLQDSALAMDNIVRVYAGILPATEDGGTELTKRPVIHAHGNSGGPQGLYSVSGVKFTTSRMVAEHTLKYARSNGLSARIGRPESDQRPPGSNTMTSIDYAWMPEAGDERWKSDLVKLIVQESVLHLDDLVLRRTGIGDNPARVRRLSAEIAALFDWDEHRREQEIRELLDGVATGSFIHG